MDLGPTLETEREGTETLQSERPAQARTNHRADSVHLVSGGKAQHRPRVAGRERPPSRRAARATPLYPAPLDHPAATDLLRGKPTVRGQQPHARGTEAQRIRSIRNGDQWSYR